MKIHRQTKALLAVLLTFPFFLAGQGILTKEEIGKRFDVQLEAFPQEKIHLHTDRDFYVPGEKIWFKAYLADALTHRYPTTSRYVYVELISPTDTLVNRLMIRPSDGLFHGYMPLTELVESGDYTLRAYTRYMENAGADYFFSKNIRIGRLNTSGLQTSKPSADSRRPRTAKDDYELSFFPEGGNLVEGAFCKVAFKALKANGTPENISGMIVDGNGSTVVSVETFHEGMGAFGFVPASGNTYRLKCSNGDGLEKEFDLPRSQPSACALTVSQRYGRINVGVRKSPTADASLSCYLLVHCRGTVLNFSTIDRANELIAFSENELPGGIIHLLLFDRQMNPLSERLVFNKSNASYRLGFRTDKAAYSKRDKAVLELSLKELNAAGGGHFSVAVTDDKDVEVDSTTSIQSSLLLSSELKGYIANPAFYLRDDATSSVALDYLMLTHGWTRYAVPEVVRGNIQRPQIPYQTSQAVSGTVKGPSSQVAGSEILVTADGDFGVTAADSNGRFVLQDFEYPDSIKYFVQVTGSKGSASMELVLDEESFPPPAYARQSQASAIRPSTGTPFLEKAEQRSKYDDDMRMIYLNEVVVTASRIEKKDESRLQFWGNRLSDATIRRKDFEKSSPRFVSELLRKIPGVSVYPEGGILIRGTSSLNPILPLVLIDGIPVDWPENMTGPYDSPVESVNVNSVESIDVLKGASAASFGTRGAGGVISITTTRGIDDVRRAREYAKSSINSATFTPLGYQKPVEFYSPKYETLEAKHLTIPDYRTTIFWKPDIIIPEDGDVASVEFYASDFPTSYSVVIEGLTADGKIIRQVEKIRVE